MNWLCVHTVATVVISLIVTLAGSCAPTDVISAMAGLSPLDGFAADLPPFATRYRIDPLGVDEVLIANRPSVPVRTRPNWRGLPVLAAKSVTVELAIGAPAPKTWPVIVAALATPAPTQSTPTMTKTFFIVASCSGLLRKDRQRFLLCAVDPRLMAFAATSRLEGEAKNEMKA